MEWNFDRYTSDPVKPAAEQTARPAENRPRPAPSGTGRQSASQPRRRSGSLPPWILVFGCMVLYAFFFHVWTENNFSVGRFLTLVILSVGIALLQALVGTIGRRRKYHTIFALVVVILWAVLYLMEYFILDAFQNFYTLSGIFSGAGNAGEADFAKRTLGLVGKNLWRVALFALPIAAYFLANRFLRLPRILTRGMRRYLAAAGGILLAVGLLFAAVLSPDSRRMGSEYNFTDAVHGFGLPMGLVLDNFHSGSSAGGFDLPDEPIPAQTKAPAETQPPQTDANGVTVPVTTEAPTEPAPQYNVQDLDFDRIINTTSSDSVRDVSRYLASVAPSNTNEMTGFFQGKNLILITAEAFSAEAIDKDLTPTLYRMATQGIHFTDYYQPAWGGSTSSGEFSVMTGIEPARGVKSIQETIGKNMDITIGNKLKALGYFTRAYHNNTYTYYDRDKTHENLGYEKFIAMGNGMEEGVTKVWPASDKEMFDFTVPTLLENQPFSAYYMTVSGHGLYSWMGNSMSNKNRDAVQGLTDKSETVKAYMACNLELEYAMADLLQMLEQAGAMDNTVVVLTADHYPYCLEKSDTWGNDQDYLSELYGYQVNDVFQRDHNALIIWSGCLEGKNLQIDTPTFSLDIVPTLCNLFGVEFDSRLLVGRDVFSDQIPLVFWPDHSWKTDMGSWNASKNTGTEFTPAPGAEVTEDYLNDVRRSVSNKLSYSYSILGMDYFDILFGD